MSPSMAHSMKKVSGDGRLNWRWAGEGEKKEANRHMASPRLRLLTGETPGGRKEKPQTASGGEKFGGGGVAGVRRHQVEDSLSLRIDT